MRCKESEQFQGAVEEAGTTLAERKRMATAADFEHAELLCGIKLSAHDTAAYMSTPAYLFLTVIGIMMAGVLSKLKISVYGTTAYRPFSIFLFPMPFCLIEKGSVQ